MVRQVHPLRAAICFDNLGSDYSGSRCITAVVKRICNKSLGAAREEEALRQNKLVPTCLNSAPHHPSFSRLNISYLDGDDFNEKLPKILDILQGLASKARKAVAPIINRHSELNEINNIRELVQTSTYYDLDKLKYLRIKLKSWIKINSTSEHYTLS